MKLFLFWKIAVGACLAGFSLLAAAPSDFSLRSVTDGQTFTLSEAKGKFVALHFLLRTECPVCLKHTREYASLAAGTPEVLHLFIKPDSEEEIKAWARKAGDGAPPLTIYQDPDARLARQFDIPGGYPFHGETVHYPALVLLDPSGKEVFRYVGKNNADRFGAGQFSRKLAEIQGGNPAAVRHYNLGPDRVAVQGYDPVAYHTRGRAEKGNGQILARHLGVTYHFASPENRALFLSNPEKYLPAYGGWCATAMAKGEKVAIDPAAFKITGGRLFLFFKAFYANALKDWVKDEPRLTAQADEHWKRIAGE